jgi:hypothetical protein
MLRRQFGQNPGESRKNGFTMAVWKAAGETVAYDGSAVKNPAAPWK